MRCSNLKAFQAYIPEGHTIIQHLTTGQHQCVFKLRDKQNKISILKIYIFNKQDFRKEWVSDFRQLQAQMWKVLPAGNVTETIIHLQNDETDTEYIHVQHKKFLPGLSLERLLYRGGMPLRFSIKASLAFLRALKQVHDTHIVHSDLKPGQLLVAWGAPPCFGFDPTRIFIMDFDNAVYRPPDEPPVCQNTIVISRCYAPPELVDSRAIKRHILPDRMWDVYAAGVTVIELLTGRVPCIWWHEFDKYQSLKLMYKDSKQISFRDIPTLFKDNPVSEIYPQVIPVLQNMLSRRASDRTLLEEAINVLSLLDAKMETSSACWSPVIPDGSRPTLEVSPDYYVKTMIDNNPWWRT